jgi:hypothetical protein
MKRPSTSRTTVHLGGVACLIVLMTAFGILAIEPTLAVPSPAVSSVTPPATSNPAPTAPLSQPAVVAEPTSRPGAATAGVSEPTFRLYMPDGQLKSHLIRVYVTRDIQHLLRKAPHNYSLDPLPPPDLASSDQFNGQFKIWGVL